MTIVWFVLGTFALLIVVSGTYVFVTACVRQKEMPWFVEEELNKTPYGKYYQFLLASRQWLRDHSAEEVAIISFDGLRLHGLWIPVANARGTVILAHGYRSTKLLDFGCAFEFFHDRGMNILVPDQRSHGKSEGQYITFGVKESRDMQAWTEYHNQQFGEFPVVLYGISMGASTMLYLADKHLPDNVKGIMADCGFTTPKDIISWVFRTLLHLPSGPSIWFANLLARIFAGFRLDQEDTRKSLSRSRLPVLMVHGMKDGFVPCEMTQAAYRACNSPKRILLVDDADHGVSFLKDPAGYSAIAEAFLDEVIGKIT